MDREEMLETIFFIINTYDDEYLEEIYDKLTATKH